MCERHRNYLLLLVVCLRQGLDMKYFCESLLQKNLYPNLMPCLNGEEGSRLATKCMNVTFDEIKMCMIILHDVPFGISTAY